MDFVYEDMLQSQNMDKEKSLFHLLNAFISQQLHSILIHFIIIYCFLINVLLLLIFNLCKVFLGFTNKSTLTVLHKNISIGF